MTFEQLKEYIRVDYSDDDELIQLMQEAVLDEFQELIPNFDRNKLTNRQKILLASYVKDLYDNRGNMTTKKEDLRYSISSMMLKETLR